MQMLNNNMYFCFLWSEGHVIAQDVHFYTFEGGAVGAITFDSSGGGSVFNYDRQEVCLMFVYIYILLK